MPLSFFHWSLLPLIPDFLLPYYHRHPPINMSVTIAAQRDLLGEFLLLLESRNGQDKFTRLIQYAAKFGKWQAEEEKKEQWIKVFGELYVAMSTVRKVLRFFRSIAVLRALRIQWNSAQSVDLALLLNSLAKLFLASYFAADHVMFASRIGLWKPSAETLNLANTITEGSWLGEIVTTILEQLVRLSNLSAANDSPAVSTAKSAAFRALIRNLFDLPIALHFLKLSGNVPHGYFGLCGVGSSAISLWEAWPTVLVAKTL